MYIYTHKDYRHRATATEWVESDRFHWQCALQPLPRSFLSSASGETNTLKRWRKSHAAQVATGTVTKQLLPATTTKLALCQRPSAHWTLREYNDKNNVNKHALWFFFLFSFFFSETLQQQWNRPFFLQMVASAVPNIPLFLFVSPQGCLNLCQLQWPLQ